MEYENIKNDGTIVIEKDKRYSSKTLLTLFLNEITKSNIVINSFKKITQSQYLLQINLNNNDNLDIVFNLKTVTGAGWKDKLDMKRVQVSNMKNEHPETILYEKKKSINIIFGYYNFDDNPILVARDSYRYLNHKTNRSCYVTIDTLNLGYKYDIYRGVVSSQVLWVFKGELFIDFINDYLKYIENTMEGKQCQKVLS